MAIRYLLGTLTDDEKARLEERYFLDDSDFEQLEIAEDELIDRFVRNDLSEEEARRFQKLLISPRLAERVEVARILAKRTAPQPQKEELPEVPVVRVQPRRPSWWENFFGPAAVATPAFRPAMALALTFMLLTTVALIFVWTKLRTDTQRLAREQQQREVLERQIAEEQGRSRTLEEQLNQARQQNEEQQQQFAEKYEQLAEQQRQTAALIFPFTLSPGGGTRGSGGGSGPTIKIPRGVRAVSIDLNVTHGDYSRYNAIVRNADSGKEVATPAQLEPFTRKGRKYITLRIDANHLTAGTYTIRVNGVTSTGEAENFDDYPFQVTR